MYIDTIVTAITVLLQKTNWQLYIKVNPVFDSGIS